jgi:predicted nucleotidyltransferase component of viral defense system
MIPRAFITEWREDHPWREVEQVEQDLVISRALVELFSNELLMEHLAFRGGTALHKIFMQPAARYSEDIDLVQLKPADVNDVITAIEQAISPWLGPGTSGRDRGNHVITYRFESEIEPVKEMRLKVDLNTGESFAIRGILRRDFEVVNSWFRGAAFLPTYELDELLATKLRALLDRRHGRDLFDLWFALSGTNADAGEIVRMFVEYLLRWGRQISGAEFQLSLNEKLEDPDFRLDVDGLLRPEIADSYDVDAAGALISERLLALMP